MPDAQAAADAGQRLHEAGAGLDAGVDRGWDGAARDGAVQEAGVDTPGRDAGVSEQDAAVAGDAGGPFDAGGSVDACADPLAPDGGAPPCGCGAPDRDGDGTPDCLDECPEAEAKVAPGRCGCDAPEGTCPDGGPGLLGTYYRDLEFGEVGFERVDPTLNFDFGHQPPAPGFRPNYFSVRWRGSIRPAFTELYTLITRSDDGVRVRLDGELVIDNFTTHQVREDRADVLLEAERTYELEIEYFEGKGKAVIQLLWASPSQEREVVPAERLRWSPPATDP